MPVSDQAIMDALGEKLSVSVLNLCERFAVTVEELLPQLSLLQQQGRIRSVQSACAGGCASCSGCPSASQNPGAVTATSVVISLERALRGTER